MPADTARTMTTQVPGIPLHLIPKTIADLIKDRRRPVYRITARKMFQNRYMLTVETRKRGSRRVQDKRTDTESGMPGRNT
jgi:hypothetical protein